MDKIDFSLIKAPLVTLFASLLFLLLSVLTIDYLVTNQNQNLTKITQAVNNSTDKLQKRLEATKLYQAWHKEFPNLLRFSFQHADKLHWLESIQANAERLNLPSITYDMKAQMIDEQFTKQSFAQSSIYSTLIEIKAGLVHEQQLLSFFEQLRHSKLGSFSVEKCTLTLNGTSTQFKPERANVTAQCVIKWYILDKKTNNAASFNNDGLM